MNTHLATLGISCELVTARGLHEHAEATTLEIVETGANGQDLFLVHPAAKAWRCLKAAALTNGANLFIVSVLRSIERQAAIIRRKLERILAICTPLGFSKHHTGRAVDLPTVGSRALDAGLDQPPAYAWLTERAAGFGHHLSYPIGNPWAYQYEPWHWCFRDVPSLAGL